MVPCKALLDESFIVERGNMKIILISGKMRAGKDTCADYLQEDFEKEGLKVCRLQISYYLKRYAIEYFGWDGKEETKPRELLQTLGTDIIREKIDPLFHVKRTIQDIEVLSYFFDVAIISDVRFRNEIEEITAAFHKKGVYAIHVVRPNYVSEGITSSHVSENDLNDYHNYDFEIINDGTLEEYKEKTHLVFEEIM